MGFSQEPFPGLDHLPDMLGHRGAAAANGHGSGLHVFQGIVSEFPVRAHPMPGLGHRIVFFPAVGIHENRPVGSRLQFPDQAPDVFRFGAVDPQGLHFRELAHHFRRRLPQRHPFTVVESIPAGKADPERGPQFPGDPGFHQCFLEPGLGLEQQPIRTGFPQQLGPPLMEIIQFPVAETVMAPVLRAIRQIGAVGPHSGQAQRPDPSGSLPFLVPPFLACFLEKGHRPGDQVFRSLPAEPIGHKAWDGSLIAAGDPRIGPGPEILQMDLFHQFRPVGQHPGGPQAVVQIRPQVFQRRAHGTIDDQDLILLQDVFQCLSHAFLLMLCTGSFLLKLLPFFRR